MRTSLEATSLSLSLLLLSVPISGVLGQQHLHERRLASAAAAGQTLTETVTSFVTVTAASAAAVATSVTSTTSATSATSTTFPQDGTSLDVSLIPAYGITQNVSLNDGTANCAGLDNKAIPCDCPPDPTKFVSFLNTLVTSGAQKFPTSNSTADQLTRLESCLVALQNVFGGSGSGVGCPVVSTDWAELQTQLKAQI